MKWTRLGWIMPVLVIVIFFVSLGVGVILTSGDDIPVGILVGAGVMVLLAPLHLLLGLALNSERTPSGRRWHNRHTSFNAPIQGGFGAQLILALMIGSATLGKLTSPLYGWLLFGGAPVVGLLGYGLFDKKRHLGPVSGLVFLYVLLALVIGSVMFGQTFGALYGWLFFGGAPVVGLLGYGLFDKERHLGPVGGWAFLYVLLALVIGPILFGQTFGALYGWLLFGGVLVVLIGCIRIFVPLIQRRGVSNPGNAVGSTRADRVDSNLIRRPTTR